MSSLLEAYLDQVAAHLSALPAKRRNEELREIRAHLLNAVAANCKMNQPQEEAARNAVVQFGMPDELGKSLFVAWQREEKLNKRSFWGAAACTPLLSVLMQLCLTPEAAYFEKTYFNHIAPADFNRVMIGFEVAAPLLAGAIIGIFFSRRIVAGVTVAALLQFVFSSVMVARWAIHHTNVFNIHAQVDYMALLTSWSFWYTIAWLFALRVLPAVFAAWVVSRWRIRGMKRLRLVRG